MISHRTTTLAAFGIAVLMLTMPLNAAGPLTLAIPDQGDCSIGTDPTVTGVSLLNFSMTGDAPENVGAPATPTISGVKIVKAVDSCTIRLFHLFTTGNHVPNAVVRVYDANKIEHLRVTLSEVVVTTYNLAPGQEGVTLSFSRIEMLLVDSGARMCFNLKTLTSC